MSQPTSLLTDIGGLDILIEGKQDVTIMPPVSRPKLNEFMLNLSERRDQALPVLLAL